MPWPTLLASDAIDRRHVLFSSAICLETAVCFAGLGCLLLLGTIIMPARLSNGDLGAGDSSSFALMVVMGWCGLGAVARVVFLLCARRRHDQLAGWTLLGLACGVGITLYIWHAVWNYNLPDPWTMLVFACLPLACTAHLVYLARGPLFTRPTALP